MHHLLAETMCGAGSVYYYMGKYDGRCEHGINIASAVHDLSTVDSKFQGQTGIVAGSNHYDAVAHQVARDWCDNRPDCLGYGAAYEIDRLYMASGQMSALTCAYPPHCGSTEATNGCFVKFSCSDGTPYTFVPTTAPTTPTASPTASPTTNPTSSPTASPTVSPTASPTGSPTASPTGVRVDPTLGFSTSARVPCFDSCLYSRLPSYVFLRLRGSIEPVRCDL